MNPTDVRNILNSSVLTTFIDESEKLSSFKMKSGRELALIEENKIKVSLYVETYPMFMPDVYLTEVYEPQSQNKGRHSNLHYISTKLGYKNKAYLIHINSVKGLDLFLNWYQYA